MFSNPEFPASGNSFSGVAELLRDRIQLGTRRNGTAVRPKDLDLIATHVDGTPTRSRPLAIHYTTGNPLFIEPIKIFACLTDEQNAFVFTVGERLHINRCRVTISQIDATTSLF